MDIPLSAFSKGTPLLYSQVGSMTCMATPYHLYAGSVVVITLLSQANYSGQHILEVSKWPSA